LNSFLISLSRCASSQRKLYLQQGENRPTQDGKMPNTSRTSFSTTSMPYQRNRRHEMKETHWEKMYAIDQKHWAMCCTRLRLLSNESRSMWLSVSISWSTMWHNFLTARDWLCEIQQTLGQILKRIESDKTATPISAQQWRNVASSHI